jgi:hypothetical protein
MNFGKENTSKDRMFNDLIDFLNQMQVAFLSSQVSMASRFYPACATSYGTLSPFTQNFLKEDAVSQRNYRNLIDTGIGKSSINNNPGYFLL